MPNNTAGPTCESCTSRGCPTPAKRADIMRYRHAVEDVVNRLIDLADIVEADPTYDPVGLLRATEKRCRRLLAGGEYGDTMETLMQELANG